MSLDATCRTCILSATVPGVRIDEQGICSGCRAYQSSGRYSNAAFAARMEEGFRAVREKRAPYHVLSMFSGGKDSAYLLYLLKRRYGLRTLAFAVIHPFVNDLSIRNMDLVAKRLGVDLMKLYVEDRVHRELMRYSFLSSPRYGLGEMFGCTTCSAIYHRLAHVTAIRMGIPYVADGTDPTQSTRSIPVLVDGARLKAFYLRPEKSAVDRMLLDALPAEYRGSMYDFDMERLRERDFPTKVSPFTFIGYHHDENVNTLVNEGILTREQANPEATNCDLLHLLAYISFRRFGCHPFATHIAQAVRTGVPTLVDQQFVESGRRLTREEHLTIFAEYKLLLEHIGRHPNLGREELLRLRSEVPTMAGLMGEEHLLSALERITRIHHWAAYFDLDLQAI